MFYEITDRCVGCATCAKRCPTKAISGERRTQHYIDPSLCKECGACFRQCPTAAILDPQGERRAGKPIKELPRARIDPAGCAGCQNCRLTCAFCAIQVVRPRVPILSSMGSCSVDALRCQGCGGCVSVCPTGSARIL